MIVGLSGSLLSIRVRSLLMASTVGTVVRQTLVLDRTDFHIGWGYMEMATLVSVLRRRMLIPIA